MILALNVLLWVAVAALLVPCAVFCLECALALLPGGRSDETGAVAPPFAVLVPAHNESAVIQKTLKKLKRGVRAGDRLIVIADNCSDDTAKLARDSGAEVIEREDPDNLGKGFAIRFGVEHLQKEPLDAVVLVDADCEVSVGGLERLARAAVIHNRPVQADYLLRAPNKNPGAVISALAIIVKNRVRPEGMHRVGLPCQLTGSGMAFPWEVLRDAPQTGAWLVEDMLIGIELALQGHPPIFCPGAEVVSVLPNKKKAALGQRRRWEHGHLATLKAQAPRLIFAGLRRASLGLLAMGLDLAVPPLALLVMMMLGMTIVAALLPWFGASWGPAIAMFSGLCALGFTVLAAWFKFARKVLPFRFLLSIPAYMLWKVPLYFSFLTKGKHDRWERTRRAEESPPRGDSER